VTSKKDISKNIELFLNLKIIMKIAFLNALNGKETYY
jgi:hypothetical protein